MFKPLVSALASGIFSILFVVLIACGQFAGAANVYLYICGVLSALCFAVFAISIAVLDDILRKYYLRVCNSRRELK